LYLLLYLV